MAGDLVGLAGDSDGVLLKAEVGAHEDEGQADAEPEQHEGEHGGHGHGRRGSLGVEHHVQDEEDDEDGAWDQTEGGEEG